MKFYWTDAISGRGFLIEASEEKAWEILMHYFEASRFPLEGVKYPEKAIQWNGVFYRKGGVK